MAGLYQSQLELPVLQQLEAHDLIARMTQSEMLNRSNERMTYYLKLAKLRLAVHPENVECSASRNLTKQQLATLLEGHYIQHAEPVLITQVQPVVERVIWLAHYRIKPVCRVTEHSTLI